MLSCLTRKRLTLAKVCSKACHALIHFACKSSFSNCRYAKAGLRHSQSIHMQTAMHFACLEVLLLQLCSVSAEVYHGFCGHTMGIINSFRPAATQLTHTRPQQLLSSRLSYILIVESVLISCGLYWSSLCLLLHQPWYKGATGSNVNVSRPCYCHRLCP